MKHGNKNRKFQRPKKQREALVSNLASSFILHEKIVSTEARIKTVRPFVEKLVTRAKVNNLANKKYLISSVNKNAASKLVQEIAPKFTDRSGGYTRIIKMPRRLSDGAKMATLPFVADLTTPAKS